MKDIIIKNRYLDSLSSGDLLNNGRLKVQDIQGNLIFCEDFFGEINCFNKKNGKCLSDSRCKPIEIVEEINAFALNSYSYLPESEKYSFLSRISKLTIIEKSNEDMVPRRAPKEYLIQDLNLEFCYNGNRMVRVCVYGHRFYRLTLKFSPHSDSDSAWCFAEMGDLDDHSRSLITSSYVQSESMKTLEIIIDPASDEEEREYWENYNTVIKDKTLWSF